MEESVVGIDCTILIKESDAEDADDAADDAGLRKRLRVVE